MPIIKCIHKKTGLREYHLNSQHRNKLYISDVLDKA